MDVVLKLRELRRMRGLTQQEAALRSGIGVKTLSSYESGQRIGSIKVAHLLALLSAYHVTPAEFFGAGVERAVFRELERLSAEETTLIASLRALPEPVRTQVREKFLAMIDGAAAADPRPRLRAVR